MHTYFNVDTQKDDVDILPAPVIPGQGHLMPDGLLPVMRTGLDGARIDPVRRLPVKLRLDVAVAAEAGPHPALQLGQGETGQIPDCKNAHPGEVARHPRAYAEHLVDGLLPQMLLHFGGRQRKHAAVASLGPNVRGHLRQHLGGAYAHPGPYAGKKQNLRLDLAGDLFG